jgi:hypothetical protein
MYLTKLLKGLDILASMEQNVIKTQIYYLSKITKFLRKNHTDECGFTEHESRNRTQPHTSGKFIALFCTDCTVA